MRITRRLGIVNAYLVDPARLATGHGKVVESPGEAMDRAIARAA